MEPSTPQLRLVREADEPLGLFLRPGKDNHRVITQLLSEGRVGMSGSVFDATHLSFQGNLRDAIVGKSLDAILDPRMMELASAGGHTSPRAALGWAAAKPHVPNDFTSKYIEQTAEAIAQHVVGNQFTGVLAPTHYLEEGQKDAWLPIDRMLTAGLRERLDANGGEKVVIHYPLATSTKVFLDARQRKSIKAELAPLRIDRLWLRIHPFGSDSGDTILERYMVSCRDLHDMHVPLIAEKAGVLGLALLAFGAVSGVESGIAAGETFDYGRLKKVVPPRAQGKNAFGRQIRVYIPGLGMFLTGREANQFFEARSLRQFACTDKACCPQGQESMIKDHRRHFTLSRMEEIGLIGSFPPSFRANGYLERILRPATDNIGRALSNDKLPESLRNKLETTRKRLANWRATLGGMVPFNTVSLSTPLDRIIRRNASIT